MKDKKELIIETAIEVIAKKGFENTEIIDIAIASGIAVGIIYNYFKSKIEIMEYIIIMEFGNRGKVLKKAIENNGSFPVVIDAILEYHIVEIRESPSLVKLIMQETFKMIEYSNVIIRNIINENDKIMTEFIVQAQHKGEVSRDFEATFIAVSILYSFRTFAYAYVMKEIPNLDLEKIKKQILQFYGNGLV
ncbi:MAG: TetR/AcrR family transcriptional regulator [Clostridiaceae bacterium]|nr:TetR/AcrR family transcriptional regulator [Clostridiaceae bacterium]